MAKGVSVRIDQTKLEHAIMGPSTEFVKTVNREIIAEARLLAPKRTGRLAAAHINVGVLRRGPYAAEGTVRNVSEYAEYVHDGTTGPIVAKGHRFLKLPAGPNTQGKTHIFVRSVRGQKANPWLLKAAELVAARHGARVSKMGR